MSPAAGVQSKRSKKKTTPAPHDSELAQRAEFVAASKIGDDFINSQVFDFFAVVEDSTAEFDNLVELIEPGLRPRMLAAEERLMKSLRRAKGTPTPFSEYETAMIEELEAEKQAAYLIGVAIGWRLGRGAR